MNIHIHTTHTSHRPPPQIHIHIHTPTNTRTHVHTHTNTHIHTHMNTHRHTHTYTHTHLVDERLHPLEFIFNASTPTLELHLLNCLALLQKLYLLTPVSRLHKHRTVGGFYGDAGILYSTLHVGSCLVPACSPSAYAILDA